MNDVIDTIKMFQYHKNQTIEYGEGTAGALGWKQAEGQQARFEVLSNIGNLNGCSVMDIGCGYGDLKTFLDKKFSGIRYAGIDLISEFLDIATERHKDEPDTVFYQGNFELAYLPNMDYVLASGALSYTRSDPDFIYRMIEKLYSHCSTGLGFNLMAGYTFSSDLLSAYPYKEIVAFCQSISPRVVLTQGYYEDDYTVYLYRG